MMLRLYALSVILLLYGQCFAASVADSSAISTVKYNLVNTSDALLEYRKDLKDRVKFEDGQMTFTMNGKPGSFSGILVSDSGDLEMTMKPLDLEAERSGKQKLTLKLPAGDVDFGFTWEEVSKDIKKLNLKVTGAKPLEPFFTVKELTVNYDHNGKFTGFVKQNIDGPFDKNDTLLELKGLEAADGKQLINFTLQWTDQASDFQLVFDQGIYLATIIPEKPTTTLAVGSSTALYQSNGTTPKAESAGFEWYWILIIILVVAIIGGGLGYFGYKKLWKKRKSASNKSPKLSPDTSATQAKPTNEPELPLKKSRTTPPKEVVPIVVSQSAGESAPKPSKAQTQQASDVPTAIVVSKPTGQSPAPQPSDAPLPQASSDAPAASKPAPNLSDATPKLDGPATVVEPPNDPPKAEPSPAPIGTPDAPLQNDAVARPAAPPVQEHPVAAEVKPSMVSEKPKEPGDQYEPLVVYSNGVPPPPPPVSSKEKGNKGSGKSSKKDKRPAAK